MSSNNTDIVYVLGSGSGWQNNEIRYSLRSVEKHLHNYRKVYIVGERPDFINLKNVFHVPHKDRYGKDRNIMEKIKHVCQFPQLSDKFLLFNDDHYLMTEFDAPRFPYYRHTTLEQKMEQVNSTYASIIRNTLFALKGRRRTRYFFDVHTPILYDKSKFIEVMNLFDWSVRGGYIIKSLYCNMIGIKGVEESDCKLYKNMSCHEMDEYLSESFVFSTPDHVTREMATYLEYKFPDKSKYEL